MATDRITVRFQDGRGYEATSDAYANLAAAGTLTQVQTALAAWLTLLNNVTAAKIIGCTLHRDIDVSGLTANTPTGTAVNEALGLSFPNADDGLPWAYVVPAFKESLMVGGNPNTADGGTIDLLADVMEAAFTVAGTGDSTFTNPGGHNLTALRRAFPATRKFGKRLAGRHSSLGA